MSTPNETDHNTGQKMIAMTIVVGRLSYPKTNGPNMRFMNVSASC